MLSPNAYFWLFAGQLAAAWFMTGLIWVIQLVHYPLFDQVSPERFVAFEKLHAQRITWIVGPVMLLELALAVGCFAAAPTADLRSWCLAAGLLLAACWVTTAALSVPAHNKLAAAWSADAHRSLVDTNWIRTVCWTARGVLLVAILPKVVRYVFSTPAVSG